MRRLTLLVTLGQRDKVKDNGIARDPLDRLHLIDPQRLIEIGERAALALVGAIGDHSAVTP